MRGKTMFLRLFLTLLLMAGLTVDFHTMSLGFGTAVYACGFDDDWNSDWYRGCEDCSIELYDVVVSGGGEDDDPTWYTDWGWEWPDDDINDDEFEIDEDIDIPDDEPSDPEPEDECEGEQCPICGGYISSGTMFRSSGENASSCIACTCSECKKVNESAEKHINHQNYKTLLNDMTADDMAGKVGVMLDWGAQNPNNVGEMQWTGRTYDNLSSAQSTIAAEKKKNPNYGSPTIVGAVYHMEEGQTTFTDRQLVDLLEMHAHGISFSGIYLVGGGSVYSLRINSSMGANSVIQSDIQGLRDALDGDYFDAENSTYGKFYQDVMISSDGNELYSKISMYNEMNFGISFLKGKLAGEDYSFSKIEASMSSESGLNEINGEKCE